MKLNFKKLFLLAILFASFNCYSQECVVEKDPISGEKICKFSNKQKTLKYEYKYGGVINFFVTFNYSGEQNVLMPKGSEIFIKLKNDSIIKLNSIVDAMPQTKIEANQYGARVYTYYTFAFELTPLQIKTLANSDVVFLRYPAIDGGTIDYEVKGLGKAYAKKITKGAQCIMENL